MGGSDPGHKGRMIPGELIIWDVANNKPQHILHDSAAAMTGVAWHPDCKQIATISLSFAESGQRVYRMIIWDADHGTRLHVFERLSHFRTTLLTRLFKEITPRIAFSPDGNWLVASPLPIVVWRTKGWQEVWSRSGQNVAFAGDSRLFTIEEKVAYECDLASGEQLRKIGPIAQPHDLSYSQNADCLSTVTRKRTLELLNLTTGETRQTPMSNVNWGALHPHGDRMLVGYRNGVIESRSISSLDKRGSLQFGHRGSISHGVFSNDGRWLVTGSEDSTVRIWDANGAPCEYTVQTDLSHDLIGDIAFSADGERVRYAASVKPNVGLSIGCADIASDETAGGDRREGKIATTFMTHWPRTDFAFSPDGQRLAAPLEEDSRPKNIVGHSISQRVGIWSAETFELLATIDTDAAKITSLTWDESAERLAVATDDAGLATVTLYDVAVPDPSLPAAASTEQRLPTRLASQRIDGGQVAALSFHRNQLAVSTGASPHSLGPEAIRQHVW